MSVTKLGAFSIGMAFVGTVIGAGFASGQEIMQFFGAFGMNGVAGLGVALVFFFLYAYLSMVVGQRMNSANYAEVMSAGKNRFIMIFVDVAMFSFLFGVLVIMMAGSSAMFQTQFPMPSLPETVQGFFGGIVLVVLTVLTTWWGLSSIQKGFSIAVPILVVGSAIVALYVSMNPQVAADANTVNPMTNPMVGNWFTSALIYVAFNMLVTVCVVIPMGFQGKGKLTGMGGALIGAASLVILGLVLTLGIINNYSLVADASMPMLTLAIGVSPTVGYIYSLFLFAAIYSTALGLVYGILARFKTTKWYNDKYDHLTVIIVCLLCLVLSKVGFVSLVGTVYPFYGYISCFLLFCLIFNFFYYAPKRNAQKN